MKDFIFNLQRFDNINNAVSNTIIGGVTSTGDTVQNSGDFVEIFLGEGKDSVKNTGDDVTIFSGAGNDTVNITNEESTSLGSAYRNVIVTDDGGDIIQFSAGVGDYSSVFSGDGSDWITLGWDSASIGNNNIFISAGADNDRVVITDSDNVTIEGGTGNDNITLIRQENAVVKYTYGDGKDTITGFNADDTLQIVASVDFSTMRSGSTLYGYDFCINFDENNSLRLKSLGDGRDAVVPVISIVDPSSDTVTTVPTASTDTATIPAATDTATVSASTETTFTYSGGNQTITNYVSGTVINYTAINFTGITFNATDFVINSGSGALTIKNAVNKILNVAVGGNTFAYIFMGNIGGVLNGGSFSQLEIIIGGNNVTNYITAGSGGSSLWGGLNSYDTLTGGAGVDTFFWGRNDGADVINNADSRDVVYLYDVTLDDVVTATGSGNQISVGLSDGRGLKVNSTENLSSTFKLADGTNWKFNHNSGTWHKV